MELINGRYRVTRHIKQHKLASTYLVVDMLNNHRTIELNILNSEYFPESLLKFYAREFVSLANINTSGIAKTYDFGLVKLMDNKKLDTNQYYFTSDYINSDYNLLHTLQIVDEKIILSLFIDLMQTINYLHLRGMVYGDINLDNAFLVNGEHGYRIVLKDLATIEYKKYDYWTSKNELLFFKAPEVMAGQMASISSDIYSLGALFVTLLGKEDRNLIDVHEKIKRIKCKNNKSLKKFNRSYFEFLDQFIEIVEKMLDVNVENRYKSIAEIVEDINNKFNSNFTAHKQEEIERVNLNTKLIGRDYEINSIVNIYNSMMKNQSDKKVVLIHGEYGIGKTKLLKEAERLMLLRNIRVYASFALDNNSVNGDRACQEILRRIIAECDGEILERYQTDIMKIIPEIGELKRITPIEPLSGQKERNRLLNSVVGLINDFLENKPAVFIIDNLHLINDFSIDLLEHLHARNKNIVILLSYCDGEIGNNKRFSQLLSKLNGRSHVLDMPIHGLSIEESSALVRDLLCMAKKPMNFTSIVYSKTYGNPLFIEEIIKDFVSQKLIYVDRKTGKWNSEYTEYYDRLPFPTTMQQAVMNQIKEIDNNSYELLRILSIFNSGVSIENIGDFLGKDLELVEKLIQDLENRGILCRKIEDRGFVFDFCNKVLKNIIRGGLEENYKRLKHKKAAELLEKQCEEGREYREELIYHLEEAGEKEKVIRYCLEIADKMEAFKNRREAIKNLEKALSMFNEYSIDERSISIIVRIGELYESEGSAAVAIKYFERAEKLAAKALNYKLQIDCLNKIAGAHFIRNELEKTTRYVKKVEKILNKDDFTVQHIEGYLESKRLEVGICLAKLEYEKAKEICEKCISVCENKYNKMKGYFYNFLGNISMNISKPEQALQYYNEGIRCFEVDNFIKGTVMCLNNLAVIYGDFYQDNEKCISYLLKMKELSEKNQIINNEIYALFNLGCSYIYEWRYDVAFEHFDDALKKAKNIEYESSIFNCYSSLIAVNLKLYNYTEAYKNYLYAKRELELYPDHGADINSYYASSADMFFQFGEYEKASEFVSKFLESNSGEIFLPKWDMLLLWNQQKLLFENDEKNMDAYIHEIRNILPNYKDLRVRINALYDIAIVLSNKNLKYKAEMIFNEAQSLVCDILPEIIKIKKTYLKGIFDSGKHKLSLLTEALERAKKTGEKHLQYKIYESIGDFYFLKKNYFYAVNYYFEACEAIKNLAVQIPDDFKLYYINRRGALSPFIKLMRMKMYSNYNNLSEVKELFNEVLSLEQLSSLFDYEDFKDILTNKFFIKSARKIYSSSISKEIKDIKDLIKNLNSDNLKNLKLISEYLAYATLATRSAILIDSLEEKLQVIASNDDSNNIPLNKYIFENVRALKEPILITDMTPLRLMPESNMMLQSVKAVICVPIIMDEMEFERTQLKEDRPRVSHLREQIKGYLYLESDRILNNFNQEGLEKCIGISKMVGCIIEKYQLQRSLSIDKLTGTYTRKYLEETLRYQIELTEESDGMFSIIMLDLDHFKQVNDRYGHQTGDKVLKETCEIIKNNLRKSDVCCRFGGEEFIVVLPGADSKEALRAAERIRTQVEAAKILGESIPVTISMGIASYPIHAQWKQELIEKADQALYVCKELGRNRCQIWSKEFSNKTKVTNKLAGIVSGNAVQDSRNVLAMVEIIELIKKEISTEEKIYNFLGRTIEITEAQYGMLFVLENGALQKKYTRKNYEEDWISGKSYNTEVLKSVIDKKQGVYMTDWDDSANFDIITGMPDWQSIVAVPLINTGQVKGVLYLTVSTNVKEFKFEDFNFINTLGELAASLV